MVLRVNRLVDHNEEKVLLSNAWNIVDALLTWTIGRCERRCEDQSWERNPSEYQSTQFVVRSVHQLECSLSLCLFENHGLYISSRTNERKEKIQQRREEKNEKDQCPMTHSNTHFSCKTLSGFVRWTKVPYHLYRAIDSLVYRKMVMHLFYGTIDSSVEYTMAQPPLYQTIYSFENRKRFRLSCIERSVVLKSGK